MNEREAFEAWCLASPTSQFYCNSWVAWQARAALAQPAPEAPLEFCCESAWRDAKALAWKGRNLDCGCDHNQSCLKCYPVDFRVGGKFDKFAAGKP